jgi:UDP-N-acetylglucosamine acyltransferase
MTMTIHRTAIISDGAQIHESAEIGPYAVIGPNVNIGRGTKVGPHVVIDGHTTIGEDCNIFAGASIGLDPQDLAYKGDPTGVIIGARVTIREYATIHRATGEGFTTIGDDCFLMNYAHVAHNCKLGRGVIMANGATLAGHVQVGDHAVFGGLIVIHQFVRV